MKIKNNKIYFLPKNSGLIYDKILFYRVIFQYKNSSKNLLPEIFDFLSLELAINFCKNIKNYDFINLVSVVEQNGFYLENENGEIIDNKTKKRYKFINKKRITEFQLDLLKKKYELSLY